MALYLRLRKEIIMMKREFSVCFRNLLFAASIMLLGACSKGRFEDVETQEVNLNLIRFEKELFGLGVYAYSDTMEIINGQYSDFLSLFGNKIIEIGDPTQAWFSEALQSFVTDQGVFELYNRVLEVYPDMSLQISALESAFGKWATVFPEKSIPDIYTYVSGFNQSIVTAEEVLGISLEKYLGANEPLYNKVYPPLPAYQRYKMTSEKITTDVIQAWSTTELAYSPGQDNLLSQMIYNGQIMYLTSKLLPEVEDSLLWGFNPEQLLFCETNEKQMWTYLIEQKLLFTTESFKIIQFINDAPFTKDFSADSPGRASIWLGYQIVSEYAKSDSHLTLRDVVEENDYQKILNKSKYRP